LFANLSVLKGIQYWVPFLRLVVNPPGDKLNIGFMPSAFNVDPKTFYYLAQNLTIKLSTTFGGQTLKFKCFCFPSGTHIAAEHAILKHFICGQIEDQIELLKSLNKIIPNFCQPPQLLTIRVVCEEICKLFVYS